MTKAYGEICGSYFFTKFLIYLLKIVDFFKDIAYTYIAGRDTLYTRVTELAFKRHVMSSVMGPPSGGFFYEKVKHEHLCILR